MPAFAESQLAQLQWRQKIYFYMERPMRTAVGRALLAVLMICILASILLYYISSLPEMETPAAKATIRHMELVLTVVFTAELLVRVAVGTLDPWRLLVCDVTLLIDVASVVPYYIEWLLKDSSTNLLQFLQLLRLLRVLKLLRHYSGWRVLSIALERSWRAVAVPVFAMIMAVLLLSGLLFALEATYDAAQKQQQSAGAPPPPGPAPPQALPDAFESMWLVFWLVTTLGFDGDFGSEQPASRLVVAVAILCGLLLTTMPITVLGSAFASAWEQKEVVEVAMKVQELLVEHGHSANDVKLVFDAFDTDGSRALDWNEFKSAMRVLHINLPLLKMRRLFTLFDADESGTIDHDEFCRLLFPHAVTEQHPAPTTKLPLRPLAASPRVDPRGDPHVEMRDVTLRLERLEKSMQQILDLLQAQHGR